MELYHYGIKGMKWGVRRSKDQLAYNRYSISSVLNKNLRNVKTPNGVTVKQISEHALDQIESRDDRKVTSRNIINALSSPMHVTKERIDKHGRASVRYIGKSATVNVNPKNGVIVTVWKTGDTQRRKYSKKG